MGPNVEKLVNLAQIWTCGPLLRPIIHQQVMLEGSESPKSPHKLVLPENVSISAFYTVILGEMDKKSGKTGHFGHFGPNWDIWGPNKAHNSPTGYLRGPKISQMPP